MPVVVVLFADVLFFATIAWSFPNYIVTSSLIFMTCVIGLIIKSLGVIYTKSIELRFLKRPKYDAIYRPSDIVKMRASLSDNNNKKLQALNPVSKRMKATSWFSDLEKETTTTVKQKSSQIEFTSDHQHHNGHNHYHTISKIRVIPSHLVDHRVISRFFTSSDDFICWLLVVSLIVIIGIWEWDNWIAFVCSLTIMILLSLFFTPYVNYFPEFASLMICIPLVPLIENFILNSVMFILIFIALFLLFRFFQIKMKQIF